VDALRDARFGDLYVLDFGRDSWAASNKAAGPTFWNAPKKAEETADNAPPLCFPRVSAAGKTESAFIISFFIEYKFYVSRFKISFIGENNCIIV
jgi:hypothetical protein